MKQIVKLMYIASVAYVFACPAIAAVGVVSSCSNLAEIDCSTYANYSTSEISGTKPNLTNDTMTFSGIYCGGVGNFSTRKCYRNTTNNSVGLAMDCTFNYSIHSSNTKLDGQIQIGSCMVGFTAYPIGTSSSTVSPGSACTATTGCSALSGTNGCLGWQCSDGRCVCGYCESNKTIAPNKMGCDCIRNSTNCQSGYPDTTNTKYVRVPLTFTGDETCLNASTVCSGDAYFCKIGYYGTEDDCTKCPNDSGGKSGTTSNASWDNYATTITKCYMSSGTTSSDTSGSFKYSSDCYYKNR